MFLYSRLTVLRSEPISNVSVPQTSLKNAKLRLMLTACRTWEYKMYVKYSYFRAELINWDNRTVSLGHTGYLTLPCGNQEVA